MEKNQLSIVNGKNPTQNSQWKKTQLSTVNGKNPTQYSQWKKTQLRCPSGIFKTQLEATPNNPKSALSAVKYV